MKYSNKLQLFIARKMDKVLP